MNFYKIGVIESRNQAFGLLTYGSAEKLQVGQVVQVPYGKLKTLGIIFEESKKPKFDVKEILKILTDHGFSEATTELREDSNRSDPETPKSNSKPVCVPQDLLHTLKWLSEYYVTNISSIVANALPKGLDKNRRDPKNNESETRPESLPELNEQQETAVKQINETNEPVILHGITGSGKTRVYIDIAKEAIANEKSVIMLTPEIGLAPQLENTFKNQFPGQVIVTHSGLTESERHLAWQMAITDTPKIIIGTRSALFSPVLNLGVILIDEFHDQAFKQTQTPKYDAVNAAAVRVKHAGAKLILGSATPDVARYYRSKELKRPIAELTETANKLIAPKIETIDMTDSANRHSKSWLSNQLSRLIENTLNNNKQILIFHNRRGTAPLMICNECGWSANCKRCAIPMTLHADMHKMRCHVCDLHNTVPINCPDCSNPDIITKGFGTKQIVSDLEKLFPAANVARFDTDNSKADSLQKRYEEIKSGDIDILVGTQMLTKGLDLPKLEAVGVVLAEAGLSLPDYITNERIFQQIHQVVGRVGRHTDNNKIIIQTYNPQSSFITCVKKDDWHSFYENEIIQRKQYNFPPFTHLLMLKNDYATRKAAKDSASKFADELNKITGVEVLGPTPAFHETTRGRFRWQIVVKATDRKKLQEIAKKLPTSGKWQFDLDPASLL